MSDCCLTSTQEMRKYERISLSLKGQLFDPGDEIEISCELVNLSAGGATLKTAASFLAGKHWLSISRVSGVMKAPRGSQQWHAWR